MAKLLHFHGAHAPGLVLFFVSLHYPLLLLTLSSAYTTQTKHFINCGSSNTEKYTNRDFVGDTSSDSVSFTKQSTSTQSSSQSSSVSRIYDTARIFRSPSSHYVLHGIDKGAHIVRLHFFPFASASNLSAAVFDVSVEGLTLLSNFRVPSSNNSPVVEEFLLSINSAKFVLYFRPQGSSFAYINALEVFLVPDGFIPGSAPSVDTSGINSSNYSGISSRVLRTVYRINVGGDEVAPGDDNLWRSWVPDSNYIHVPNAARNSSYYYATVLNYQSELDKFLASEGVYRIAKEMNVDFTNGTLYPNTTWGFNVSANAWHLVRAHFCDIISAAINTVHFNLYIYENLAELIDPYGKNGFRQSEVPFHYDFVVQPGSSGLVNISIGLLNASETTYQQAYLNGLEIMEIIGSWNSDFMPSEGNNQNKHVGLIIGLVSGSIALLCICVSAAIFLCKYRKPKGTDVSVWSPLPAFGGGSSHSRLTEQSTHGSAVPNFHLGLKIPLSEIHFATNNFDGKLLIGKGGFGNVYRGTLRDGTKVAVKRSELGSAQGFSEFQTEITVLSKIRHRHLVSLIGYCAERSEMILVYEFMEKGSLRDHLDQANLAEWGITGIQKGIIEQTVDPLLAGQINPNSLRKYGEVAEKCLQEEDDERPSMGDVLWDLEFDLQLQQTMVTREMYNDSTTDGSSILTLSNVRKLPSFSGDAVEEDGVAAEGENSSLMSASGVFSQIKIDEAR
ncbi:hypothetical protein NL676_013633 [Syzygium grande]|nr:hypothetical protein NL676_013633 [Syzygium grande]